MNVSLEFMTAIPMPTALIPKAHLHARAMLVSLEMEETASVSIRTTHTKKIQTNSSRTCPKHARDVEVTESYTSEENMNNPFGILIIHMKYRNHQNKFKGEYMLSLITFQRPLLKA